MTTLDDIAGRDAGYGTEPIRPTSGRMQMAADRRYLLGLVREAREALASEDEIAHGEAWDDIRKVGRGLCAYCDMEWPCRTQRGIARLLTRLTEGSDRT